ncbi:MAG: Crp/Fnr family transcriptional regulator, partial [Thiobacillus sp.]|nr:Crp/Fnr family transcriptional regulator [Thiobacillus sp.]
MTTLAELERFEPFRALGEDSRAVLARGLVRAECPRATMALHKGQPVSGAYVVLSGRLRVFALAPNGTE